MYCPYCGSELPNDAIYCNQCGRKIPNSNSEIQTEIEYHLEQKSNPQSTISTSPNNSDPTKTVIIVCVIAAIILCVGIVGIPAILDSVPEEPSGNIIGTWKSTSSYYDSGPAQFATIYYTFNSDGRGTEMWYNNKGVLYYSRLVKWSGKNNKYTVCEPDSQSEYTFSISGDSGHMSYNLDFIRTSTNPTNVVTPVPTSTFVPATKKPTPVPTQSPVQKQDETIKRTYSWEYNGYKFTGEYEFYKSTYNYYRNLGHSSSNLAKYVTDTTNREIVSEIAESILGESTRLGFNDYDKMMCVVAFVQSLPYTSDKVTTNHDDYARYPIETLVDNGGDCEDTSILAAAIIREMGYGCALLKYDTHVAVGVKGGDGIYGTYFQKDGVRYYYLETTGKNWDIGEIPDDYKSKKAQVIIIN